VKLSYQTIRAEGAIMKTVSLSFKELYKENGAETKYGHHIDFYSCDDEEYYDLKTQSLGLVACDGELFDLVEIDEKNDKVKLINHDGENDTIILLSIDEYGICNFK
jgi:hypothetical protein